MSDAAPKKRDRIPSLTWLAIGVALLWLAATVFSAAGKAVAKEIPWSEFQTKLAAGDYSEVEVAATRIRAIPRADANAVVSVVRIDDPQLASELARANVLVRGIETPTAGIPGWVWIVGWLFVLGWMFRSIRGTSLPGGAIPFGRSKARVYVEKEVGVSFADVAGVDEAIEELTEVLAFLKSPGKFQKLGGKMPKGILLVGPPGTGKTLLARAVAGEARVPFFSISGSEFVELFVGVGAARVRDLFANAKEKAPCIIFIDEIDALGKTRMAGPMAHEEREQTLNQLLVELDGFDPRTGVVLMAATNRPELLDPALLRAGRFDRRIVVDRPERAGRLAILKLHAREVPFEDGVDLDPIAGMTPGMAGADLANLINEAALLAVRRGKDKVGASELTEALERVIAGPEKRTRVLSPEERRRVAVHELGHALVARALPGADPIRKITIIPRGISLGHTLQVPLEDRFLVAQHELEDRIAVALGGRAAEELLFDEVSTGARDDLERATAVAVAMVRDFGMSRGLGPRSFPRDAGLFELHEPPASEATAREIDGEVRWILEQQESRATRLLATRRELLEAATTVLLGRETIAPEDLDALVPEGTRDELTARA